MSPINIDRYMTVKPTLTGLQLASNTNDKCNNQVTVNDLLALPIGIYFLDNNEAGIIGNDACATMNHLYSVNDVVGITSRELYTKECADEHFADNMKARKNRSLIIAGQHATHVSNIEYDFLTFKLPFYVENKIAGILGCTININGYHLDQFINQLNMLIATNILDLGKAKIPTDFIQKSNRKINYFSPREVTILQHLIKGLTAKEIAVALGLSKRTIENNIANMKDKSGCKSKSQLINHYYDSMHLMV